MFGVNVNAVMITTSVSSDSKSDFISFIGVLFTTSREVLNIDSQLTSVHVGWAKVLITEVWEVLTLHIDCCAKFATGSYFIIKSAFTFNFLTRLGYKDYD